MCKSFEGLYHWLIRKHGCAQAYISDLECLNVNSHLSRGPTYLRMLGFNDASRNNFTHLSLYDWTVPVLQSSHILTFPSFPG